MLVNLSLFFYFAIYFLWNYLTINIEKKKLGVSIFTVFRLNCGVNMADKKKKQDVRVIFKIGAFLGFIMLGYLGIRSYKLSVEKLKITHCTDEIINFARNVQDAYRNQRTYGEIDYKTAEKLRLFPKSMKREGFREFTNSFYGGVDIWYSSTSLDNDKSAFEISFQGLSKNGCISLMKLNLEDIGAIAVAGYGTPTPSGVLDEIYVDTAQKDIKGYNKFKAKGIQYLANDKAERACNCKEDVCSVIWKFK